MAHDLSSSTHDRSVSEQISPKHCDVRRNSIITAALQALNAENSFEQASSFHSKRKRWVLHSLFRFIRFRHFSAFSAFLPFVQLLCSEASGFVSIAARHISAQACSEFSCCAEPAPVSRDVSQSHIQSFTSCRPRI